MANATDTKIKNKEILGFLSVLFRTRMTEKLLARMNKEFFSYIRLSASYICFASDIRFASFKGEYNITETEGINITFTK